MKSISRQRGFTLIEMTVSLGIMSVISLAIGSAIVVSTKALPRAAGASEVETAVARTLIMMGEDIRFASDLLVTNSQSLKIIVPDRDDDAAVEEFTYSWSGVDGDPLMWGHTDGTSRTLIASVRSFAITTLARADVDIGTRLVTPADRLRIEITTVAERDVMSSAEFRCVNVRVR